MFRCKVEVRFKAVSQATRLFYRDRELNHLWTLEMSGIFDGAALRAVYVADPAAVDLSPLLPEWTFANSAFTEEALVFLHSANLSPDLGRAITKFLKANVMPPLLISIVDDQSLAVGRVEQSLNDYEREFYLRGILNVAEERPLGRDEARRLVGLVSAMNAKTRQLVMEILGSCADLSGLDVDVTVGQFLGLIRDSHSRKLSRSVIVLLTAMVRSDASGVAAVVGRGIVDLVESVTFPILGEFVGLLPNRAELFEVLFAEIGRFSVDREHCRAFFSALIAATDTADRAARVSQFCGGRADDSDFLLVSVLKREGKIAPRKGKDR
jgi:hypothetical protein